MRGRGWKVRAMYRCKIIDVFVIHSDRFATLLSSRIKDRLNIVVVA